MKRSIEFLPAALVVLLSGIAAADSNDMKYCRALIEKFRDVESNNQPSVDIPVAISKCESGDTATGISILENALKARRATLPPRE
ncbi:MAG TPA: hypothetical protein VMI56_09900 [Reyranella sp.]|nr:hypothetical protein [Reyranella sp.]